MHQSCFYSTIRMAVAFIRSVSIYLYFFFSSRRRHTRLQGDWSSDVCSSDLQFYENMPFSHVFIELFFSRTHFSALLFQEMYKIGRASCRERVVGEVIMRRSKNKDISIKRKVECTECNMECYSND